MSFRLITAANDMGASFFTEKMQYAIHHIGTPLFAVLISATLVNFLAAFLNRHDRRTCYLLSGCRNVPSHWRVDYAIWQYSAARCNRYMDGEFSARELA